MFRTTARDAGTVIWRRNAQSAVEVERMEVERMEVERMEVERNGNLAS
ncbi:hypothetical protein [Acidocella sp.]|nr:hypothetical protein [Acidocella sp.]NNM56333.1 hypothetical protein [Acidocella sp.]